MTAWTSSHALCPLCREPLDDRGRCPTCGQSYPRLASIGVLLPDPAAHLDLWRRQLGLLVQQGAETPRALEQQAAQPGLGDATRRRLSALARAVGEQVADITRVLGPVLGGALPPWEGLGLPRGAADYITCLFRDWGWSDGHDEENARSLATIRRVAGEPALGRTLVLGAGGCRLAYDLHIHGGAAQTVVVDVDPYLLVMAEAVIRGTAVLLTESSVNAPEVDPVGRRWTLSAPAGPLGEDVFRFFLADGTQPPFSEQTFDTVVTPWFIDQVPIDLEALVRRVHGLLAPGGRWINQGPLIYRPDALPIARWYTREELFALGGAAGFRIGAWEQTSQPHFVSPLTGRGLLETVLTFEASRV